MESVHEAHVHDTRKQKFAIRSGFWRSGQGCYKDQLRESRVPEWEKKRAGSVKSDAKQASNAEKSSEQRKMEASNGANPVRRFI